MLVQYEAITATKVAQYLVGGLTSSGPPELARKIGKAAKEREN